jgi:hypothetical protein
VLLQFGRAGRSIAVARVAPEKKNNFLLKKQNNIEFT